MIVVAGVIIILNYLYSSRQAHLSLEQSADEYIVRLSDSLELPLWTLDMEGVDKIAATYFSITSIVSVTIRDEDGRVLVGHRVADEGEQLLRVRDVVHLEKVIGRVEIGLTLRYLLKDIKNRMWSALLTMFFVVLAVILCTGILLRTRLKKPLADLLETINLMAQGEYDEKHPRVRLEEFEVILVRFDLMAREVRSREQRMQQLNLKLQEEIVEHKAAEEALRESESSYRLLVEKAGSAILIIQGGVIRFQNEKAENILGHAPSAMAGGDFFALVSPAERVFVKSELHRLHDGETASLTMQLQMQNRDNEFFDAEIDVSHIFWGGLPAQLIFLRNRSREKIAERQHQQAQKMEAIGTLAGGVAHDFNNLLTAMQGNLSLLRVSGRMLPQDLERVYRIESCIQSGAKLSGQLLGLARGGKYETDLCNPNMLVSNAVEMFGRTRKDLEICLDLASAGVAVEIDKSQIEQVLLNLYLNASQAMSGGGKLFIMSEDLAVDSEIAASLQIVEGQYVAISVRDTGPGIDQRILPRIFDPFFTTKEMGRGTGLGLASAYGIMKNHGGAIDVSSEVGCGATFTLYLPAVTELIQTKSAVIKDNTLKRGHETILLVDDEPIMLEVGCEILETLGYQVLSADNGVEACAIYAREQSRIALVLLDLVLPGMSGGEIFTALQKINPQVKVLLVSGYSSGDEVAEITAKGGQGFLAKPFEIHHLSQLLRNILGA